MVFQKRNRKNVGRSPWNKGLTKENDIRVKQMSISKKGCSTWNKGLKLPQTAGINSGRWTGGSRATYRTKARKTLEKKYGIGWNDMNLPVDAVIHHIDRNWKNNKFDNLCVMSRSEHMAFHQSQGDIIKGGN